ncbi:gamma-glutamyl-gamma-aminobutyrate hydrolase family protein [Alphaproteobacteria bacterium]|nr:gamma-glutamyl-gamma-aminobutyrate hydrolase family protein [Alphaproteobacteria bacterium]
MIAKTNVSDMFKKRIGITQNVMQHPHHSEVMDCLDTRWTKLLVPLGLMPIPMPLVEPVIVHSLWQSLQLDGVILSGGNTPRVALQTVDPHENPSLERDLFETAILNEALYTKTPILGICRGLQIINVYFGGSLNKIDGHSGTRHKLLSSRADMYLDCPRTVNSFHRWAVKPEGLGQNLVALAFDEQNNIEAFTHREHKVLAIMWHPERENDITEGSKKMFTKYFGL